MRLEWVYDLAGKEVVFTGEIEGYSETALNEIALGLGASRVKEWINKSTTDILVRGWSDRWKFGDFGRKEKQAAELQGAGHRIRIIEESGFLGLRSNLPAPVVAPNVSDVPAARPAQRGGVVGAPYRFGRYSQLSGDGDYHRDPDTMERGLHGHSSTQDMLATLINSRGLTPLSPFDKQCNFDIAWILRDGSVVVAEVKSTTDGNEAFQIRHGLGQILDYGHILQGRGFDAQMFLVLEQSPKKREHWVSLCSAHNVNLIWAPEFNGVE